MRNLEKMAEPAVLAEHGPAWLADYIADKGNATKRNRYRDAAIKTALRTETGDKCIYCESKLGHNTPGDIEHKIPTSHREDLHFSWANLTLACTECNRRKGAYYDESCPFLDPYEDDVESWLIHHGPVVYWQAGNARAETSVKILELNSPERRNLIARKIEKIEEVANLLERYQAEPTSMLKTLLKKQLLEMQSKFAEYSAMVKAILEAQLE